MSLFEKYDHRVSYVEANIAAVIVRDAVATLLNDKTMPVSFKFFIKLLFDLSRDVWKMGNIVILECTKSSYHSVLNFVSSHVCSFNQNSLVCFFSKHLKGIDIVTSNNWYRCTISSRNSKGLNPRRRYIHHVN